ncbi:N-acetylmuramoyl-L-alanine amidase [Candidatus Deianiraea vastatrix]|uniref:N-acetylmuramoyl-L-alanine amidase n=1 Tax=Candidatus Deianiraea vastatrix TaxID=2163644 RepID=A0A5B8XDE2_9RICK|nr:N-acetylmuramoyl-L-alanine amidase [Candidatus Deianiraea vastatrix]QED22905.1 Putative peptidoglycan turnover protein [Candidatus Deianiraea vastatrix]
MQQGINIKEDYMFNKTRLVINLLKDYVSDDLKKSMPGLNDALEFFNETGIEETDIKALKAFVEDYNKNGDKFNEEEMSGLINRLTELNQKEMPELLNLLKDDTRIQSSQNLKQGIARVNKDRSISSIVIHTTSLPAKEAIDVYHQYGVSANYGIDINGKIHCLVPADLLTFHAGVSHFKDLKNLNPYSIGIEIFTPEYNKINQGQYDSLILLLQYLKTQYPDIKFVATHGTISPCRKTDPCYNQMPPEFLKSIEESVPGVQSWPQKSPNHEKIVGYIFGNGGYEECAKELHDVGYRYLDTSANLHNCMMDYLFHADRELFLTVLGTSEQQYDNFCKQEKEKWKTEDGGLNFYDYTRISHSVKLENFIDNNIKKINKQEQIYNKMQGNQYNESKQYCQMQHSQNTQNQSCVESLRKRKSECSLRYSVQ